MKKSCIILALALTFGVMPLWASEDFEKEETEVELSAVQLNVNGSHVHIQGAFGKTLDIYNVAGVRVATFKIDSEDKTLNLNLTKGCYILKVGKVVRKISIR